MRSTKLTALFGLSTLPLLFGCSGEAGPPAGGGTDPASEQALAMTIAQQEVDELAPVSDKDGWTEASRVVVAFPVYLDGIDGVSYYECKVETGGQSTGYVLVNVNDTDLLVTESATEGDTLTERYRAATGRDDLRVVRYDWFASAAMDAAPSASEAKIVATVGFNKDEEPRLVTDVDAPSMEMLRDMRDRFRASVAERGSHPLYTHEMLAQTNDVAEALAASEAGAQRGDYRTISAELQHSFASGWHMPSWQQPERSNGHHIGCGNTAWAMVYAYWRQFSGKTGLFDGLDLANKYGAGYSDDPIIFDAMIEISKDTDTKWVGEDAGMTYPHEMCDGVAYAKRRGYGSTSCDRDAGTEYSKVDAAIRELRADRPTILGIHADGIGGINHYVAIEGARKKQKHVLGSWRDRDVSYLANFGWGGTRKWIYTREYGINDHKVYSAFSAYYVNVR